MLTNSLGTILNGKLSSNHKDGGVCALPIKFSLTLSLSTFLFSAAYFSYLFLLTIKIQTGNSNSFAGAIAVAALSSYVWGFLRSGQDINVLSHQKLNFSPLLFAICLSYSFLIFFGNGTNSSVQSISPASAIILFLPFVFASRTIYLLVRTFPQYLKQLCLVVSSGLGAGLVLFSLSSSLLSLSISCAVLALLSCFLIIPENHKGTKVFTLMILVSLLITVSHYPPEVAWKSSLDLAHHLILKDPFAPAIMLSVAATCLALVCIGGLISGWDKRTPLPEIFGSLKPAQAMTAIGAWYFLLSVLIVPIFSTVSFYSSLNSISVPISALPISFTTGMVFGCLLACNSWWTSGAHKILPLPTISVAFGILFSLVLMTQLTSMNLVADPSSLAYINLAVYFLFGTSVMLPAVVLFYLLEECRARVATSQELSTIFLLISTGSFLAGVFFSHMFQDTSPFFVALGAVVLVSTSITAKTGN